MLIRNAHGLGALALPRSFAGDAGWGAVMDGMASSG